MPWGLAGGDVEILLGQTRLTPPPIRISWFANWSDGFHPTMMPIRYEIGRSRRMLRLIQRLLSTQNCPYEVPQSARNERYHSMLTACSAMLERYSTKLSISSSEVIARA